MSTSGVHHVTANKILPCGPLIQVHKIRDRDTGGFAVVEPAGPAFQFGKIARDTASTNLIHHVVAQGAA